MQQLSCSRLISAPTSSQRSTCRLIAGSRDAVRSSRIAATTVGVTCSLASVATTRAATAPPDGCPSLESAAAPATPLFSSLLAATAIDGLIGNGLVATSCVPQGWAYAFTRSTAGSYPRGSLSAFFRKEQTVANCPYLNWQEPYLSDAFLGRPPSCGLVVDVGANIGLFSLHCLALAPRATIIAVEPSPTACFVVGAVAEVLLSADLLPAILAPLELKERAAMAVCKAWRAAWLATSATRRGLRPAGVERALPGKSPLVGNAVGAAVVQDDWARREQSCEHFV